MARLMWLVLALTLTGCDGSGKTSDGSVYDGVGGIDFWPPEAGRGITVDARLTAGSSTFNFDTTTLDLGAGVTVNSLTVLDGWNATANITIAPDAELGPRTAEIHTGEGAYEISDALTVVDDSFTIEPASARIGETVQVEMIGQNTEWEPGSTWATFGSDIDVTAVDVLSETYAVATVTVNRDASPGLRDVSMEVGPDVTTLYNGFTVDRVALSAVFDPTSIAQGQTLEFSVDGSGTHFEDGLSELSFWKNGDRKGDVVVDSLHVIDAEHLWGTMTASNAAELGMRDVVVTTGDEGVSIDDAFEVTGGDLDLSNVGISLTFNVARGIDNATGAIDEVVTGQAIFYIPLDPACPNSPEAYACSDGEDNDNDGFTDCYDNDCSSDPACASGPQPYDQNGVFQTYTTGGSSDCPVPTTVGAGDHVYFESPCNVVTLDKQIDSATGMIYYTAPLTIDDYCFDQLYDLHTEGEEGAIGEYVLEGVQPTVPADFELIDPEWWNNYTHSRAEDLTYTWTPAQTYGHDPQAFFVTQISGTLVATGESGFVGALPWDDGEHTYTADELSQLEAGNVSFIAESVIPAMYAPMFGFPFSTIQNNQSGSYLAYVGSMILE